MFQKTSSDQIGGQNQMQSPYDVVKDLSTIEILEKKSIENLIQENESIANEIIKIDEELTRINEKSHSIEGFIKLQQKSISLLNKENEGLLEKIPKGRKKLKRGKESGLNEKIRESIEIQNSIYLNSVKKADGDHDIQKINMTRYLNKEKEKMRFYNIDQIQQKRNDLVRMYQTYKDDVENETAKKKIESDIYDSKQINKQLARRIKEKSKQKLQFESLKAKLDKINSDFQKIEEMKANIKNIEIEIESQKSFSGLDPLLFMIDGQDTQENALADQPLNSIGCLTTSPQIFMLDEKGIGEKIRQIKQEICEIKRKRQSNGMELIQMLETLRDQHIEIYNLYDELIKSVT